MTIYVVVNIDKHREDYRIIALFSTKALADAFIKLHADREPDYEIEEYALDEFTQEGK